MFGVMGLFGFASAGVEINGAGELLQPLPLGVLVGLFVGKQLGVFGALWLAVKSGLCAAPANVRWIELYGAALLCGIGFTMSLFIGALAFPAAPETVEAAKIGTLAGSLLSALCGWAILRFARRPVSHREDAICKPNRSLRPTSPTRLAGQPGGSSPWASLRALLPIIAMPANIASPSTGLMVRPSLKNDSEAAIRNNAAAT